MHIAHSFTVVNYGQRMIAITKSTMSTYLTPISRATSIVIGVAAILAMTLPFLASAEAIHSMHITLDVRPDASVAVSEQITYDFEGFERHGIYRTIPLRYADQLGGAEEISISNVAVIDEFGNAIPFDISRSGGTLKIRIGDSDVPVSGVQTYRILYSVQGAIGHFDTYDEIYWNATGNEWEVPIREVHVAVWTPALSKQYACYAGTRGSTEKCISAVSRLDGAGKPVALFAEEDLEPGEGLTVAVGIEKGFIAEPTAIEKAWRLLMHNLPLALPLVTFAAMYFLWRRYGKDARGRGTIIPEYDAPARLSAADIAAIVNQRVAASDLSAMIVALAVRGYLKIGRIEEKTLGIFKSTDYRFHKLQDADEHLTADEETLITALFPADDTEILSSQLKSNGKLRHALADISKSVETRLVTEGYYRARPAYVRMGFLAVGALFTALAFVFFSAFLTLLGILAIALSGVIVLVFAFFMPALTRKGALVREQILGLKEYLQIAEKNRLDFHHAPERTPQLFERLLPYAMVLGVSTAWAKEFEGIYTQPPSWYAGGAYPHFTPTAFADDMKNFSSAAAAIAAPTSGSGGSGGGGFSGGGFGGGGGGSW